MMATRHSHSNVNVVPRTKIESRRPLDFSKHQRIGRFGLIREIARGGMGQVFLARDTKLSRKVAIKFLLRDDPTWVERFLIEARATARCTHENIVTIYEVGEHDGLPYMVLEYLEGHTLSDILKPTLAPKQFAELMIPVVRALERAHDHGIVHRDLKPSNIFVTDRGLVKVLDFGVARVFDTGEHAVRAMSILAERPSNDAFDHSIGKCTRAGLVVGTLPYMSPEQWRGADVDHRSDLWAVGMMFWRGLVDTHPAGTNVSERLRGRTLDATPFPSLRDHDRAVPAELAKIVERCLAKDVSERYQSASELLEDLQRFVAPRLERADTDASPYRGLASFGEDDAELFFGRAVEVRTALSQLAAWPLLAVVGPSGVGKSSFVHAGVVPAVRASGDWEVRTLRPGRTPLVRLTNLLDEVVETDARRVELADHLRTSPGLFGELLRSCCEKRRFLIVVDQLEELFTLCDDPDVHRAFLAALLGAADDTSSPVRVVLSMRADFLDRLAEHKRFLAELSRGLLFLSPPDRENLREALVQPAKLAGYSFEDDWIVEDMLDAASSPGALPLLSFAAERLWDARDRRRSMLTIAAYNEMGGVAGAFVRHADCVASAASAQNQRLLRAILTRLVTPEGTRAIVDHADLRGLGDPVEVLQIIETLVQARLVHMHTEPGHGAAVEIVHEMLITEWPMLRRWLEDNQALRGFVHELRHAARQWEARDRAVDLVWRGTAAREALEHARLHVLDLSDVERGFLAEMSRHLRRIRRRKVITAVSVVVALALVFVAGATALVRISSAEAKARDGMNEANKAAASARAAEATARDQLDQLRAAVTAREEALRLQKAAQLEAQQQEAKATEAETDAQVSRDELASRNHELVRALADAKALQAKTEAATAIAQRATEVAQRANTKLETLLEQERDRVRQLEAQKTKIFAKELQ